jgi:hypothetical protein
MKIGTSSCNPIGSHGSKCRDVVAHRENLEMHQTRKGVASSFDSDIDQKHLMAGKYLDNPKCEFFITCFTGGPRSGGRIQLDFLGVNIRVSDDN